MFSNLIRFKEYLGVSLNKNNSNLVKITDVISKKIIKIKIENEIFFIKN